MATRREDLIRSARELFETKGLSRTSVSDITQRSGVSRALFYHYFADKEAITLAVLDDFIDDFTESVRIWNENRVCGDVEGALRDCIKLVRRILFDDSHFRKTLATHENAALYLEVLNRTSTTIASYIVETTVADYQAFHEIEIEYVPETFYILIAGLVLYIRNNPEVKDEVLMTVVAQTLRLDI